MEAYGIIGCPYRGMSVLRRRNAAHWLVVTLLCAVVAYGVALVAIYHVQDWILYPRGPLWWSIRRAVGRPRPVVTQRPSVTPAEVVWLDTAEGPVEAWLIRGDRCGGVRRCPLVIYIHGTGELIEDWATTLLPYRRMGISILLPEYRGYGRSAGKPDDGAILSDLTRFYDWARRHPGVDATRIVLHGRSLGGAFAVALAAQRRPAALIVQSTFTRLASLSARLLIPPFLLNHRFESLALMAQLDLPTLILHCRHDRIVPYAHGEALHRAAKRSRFVVFDAEHNDCPGWWATFDDPDPRGYWREWWQEVEQFLAETKVLEPPPGTDGRRH